MKFLVNIKDLVKESLEQNMIFERKEALDPDYVPANLPGRERQIKELSINFRDLLTNAGSTSVSVVVVGKHGTGKTVTVRKFGEIITEIGKERGIKIMFAHVNCRKHRTVFLALVEVARQINIIVPNRGLSAQELFRNLHEHLEKRKAYLIVAFDEFDYLIATSPIEDLYLLARAYDEAGFAEKRIHYIFIIRDLSNIMKIDRSIRDQFMKNVIDFPPYTHEEIYQILKDRIVNEKAIRENAIEDEALRYIAEQYDDARLAIEALELAGKIAESEGAPIITVEHTKKAVSQLNPEYDVILRTIKDLDLHQLLLLKAILELDQKTLSIDVIENEYRNVAIRVGERPRKHTQVYDYIRKMKMLGLLLPEQRKGRATVVSVPDIIREMKNVVEEEIQNRLKEKEY